MFEKGATAPGKLFLSGEYAVLKGAPAVVTTVNRRVEARPVRDNLPSMPITSAVRNGVSAFLLVRNGSSPGRLPNILIENAGFAVNHHKLGIGSSAAIAASATGALFEWAGLSIVDHRESILEVARTAHFIAQGRKGSGADVAASVLGGTIIFTPGQTPVPVRELVLPAVFVWTGRSASTVELMGHVHRLEEDRPDVFGPISDRLHSLANALAESYQKGDGTAILAHTEAYGDCMASLGEAARVAIVTEEHARIRKLAQRFSGAAKPSGAGGGDAAVALFQTEENSARFVSEVRAEGFAVLDIQIHVDGVTVSSDNGASR